MADVSGVGDLISLMFPTAQTSAGGMAGLRGAGVLCRNHARPDRPGTGQSGAESFDIWRDNDPQDVEWRFLPEVAGNVFHPKQTMERLEDGSLIVRFRAGGRQEMEWCLARWGIGGDHIARG